MSTEIIKHQQRAQLTPLEFTAEQRQMILTSFLSGATESEASVLLELARIRRLNPITKQIHFVKRWDSNKRAEVWSAQVGIDGFRAIAERTGLYDGQDEPEFEYDAKNNLKLCKVRIYRKDWSRPVVGVAHFSEYAQKKKEGGFTHMWAEKPHVMIAKCAEALAFRKAFPEDTSGLYAPEEMPAEEKELNPPPAPPTTGKRTAEVKAVLAAKTAKLEEPKQPTTTERIQSTMKARGLSREQMAARLKGISSKDLKQITHADLDAEEAAWAATQPKKEEPPIPDESQFVAQDGLPF